MEKNATAWESGDRDLWASGFAPDVVVEARRALFGEIETAEYESVGPLDALWSMREEYPVCAQTLVDLRVTYSDAYDNELVTMNVCRVTREGTTHVTGFDDDEDPMLLAAEVDRLASLRRARLPARAGSCNWPPSATAAPIAAAPAWATTFRWVPSHSFAHPASHPLAELSPG